MANNFLVTSIFLFIAGFWVYISNRKHLMNMLISLEYVVLSLILAILMMSTSLGLEIYLLLIFLVVSVCEGSLGISLMVGIVRASSSDYLSTLNTLEC